MPGQFNTEPLGVDKTAFERWLEEGEEEYRVVPVIAYEEGDKPLHEDGPCGDPSCPCA